MKSFKPLINDCLITTNNKIVKKSIETNKNIIEISLLTKDDIDKAYEAAEKAFYLWKDTKLIDRIKLFEKLILEMLKKEKEFIYLLENEIYKNSKDSKAEFDRTIDIINYSISEVKKIQGQLLSGDSWGIENKYGLFIREPLGVTLAIAPYNYPLNLAMTKLVPALLTANTVVFKPASYSMAMGCLIGEVFKLAGFPKGVINIVTGKGSEIGNYLITNKYIKLINFTGSSQVGKEILKLSPNTIKIFELGGKDPALVLDDADLELCTKEIISGAFSYNGQRCTAIKRVLITKKTATKLVPLLVNKIKNLTVGMPSKNCQITPLIDSSNINHLLDMINQAKENGAKILIGGKNKDQIFYPTLVDDVKANLNLAKEEQFAPILPIIYCKDINEMIKVANESNYGLQAAIFTKNLDLGFEIAKKLEVGTININSATKRGPDHFPFLGVKDSGIGIQGIKDVLYAYTRPKGIVFNFSKISV